jgi:hypothetical protein
MFFDLSSKIDANKNTIDESGNIRIDFLFSYWIFAWFIFFYFLDKTTKYGKFTTTYFSPMIALWFGFLYDFLSFFYLIFINPDFTMILKYAIMLLVIKITPLYLLRNTPIHYLQDTLSLIFLFFIYIVYLHLNNTSITEVYEKTEKGILTGENKTPLFHLMNSIFSFFTGHSS